MAGRSCEHLQIHSLVRSWRWLQSVFGRESFSYIQLHTTHHSERHWFGRPWLTATSQKCTCAYVVVIIHTRYFHFWLTPGATIHFISLGHFQDFVGMPGKKSESQKETTKHRRQLLSVDSPISAKKQKRKRSSNVGSRRKQTTNKP